MPETEGRGPAGPGSSCPVGGNSPENPLRDGGFQGPVLELGNFHDKMFTAAFEASTQQGNMAVLALGQGPCLRIGPHHAESRSTFTQTLKEYIQVSSHPMVTEILICDAVRSQEVTFPRTLLSPLLTHYRSFSMQTIKVITSHGVKSRREMEWDETDRL